MSKMTAKIYKRIAVSEENYRKMQQMGVTGTSFNDVLNILIDLVPKGRKKEAVA